MSFHLTNRVSGHSPLRRIRHSRGCLYGASMEFPPGSETEETPAPSQMDTKDTLLKKYGIPLAHLDFAYVAKCSDDKELERILQILESGEEGYYPQLLATTEERLRVIKPNSRFIRKITPVVDKNNLDAEVQKALHDEINKFVQSASQFDSEMGKVKKTGGIDIPEVRNLKIVEEIDQTKAKTNRIKATDYASWDKYDPDTEILKMDLASEKLREQHKGKQQLAETVESPLKKEIKFEEIYTETEAALASEQERLKGNEFYKSGDYKEALACYTNSINMQPSIEGYNNRAQVNIMLKNYQQAMTDSQAVLKYDANNIKANIRLAQSLNELHFYRDAVKHLERVICLDPNNSKAQNLLNTVKSKQDHAAGDNKWLKGTKTRIKITEVSSSSPPRSGQSQRKVKRKSNLKKSLTPPNKSHVLVPIPGPSHMQEPYYVVLEDKDPEMIKRAQYMLYNKPQVMFVSHPLDTDDEDYSECQNDNATSDYEYDTCASTSTRNTTTLKDIKRRMKSFSKNKSQHQQEKENSTKENNQNNMNIAMPESREEKAQEEDMLGITEITHLFTEMSLSNSQTDSALEDSSIVDVEINLDGSDKSETKITTERVEYVVNAGPSTSITQAALALNNNMAIEDVNNNEINNNYDVHHNDANANASAGTGAVNGGGGEPHLARNGNSDGRAEDVETPFSFVRAWTAAQRDETYTQQASLLRNMNENRLAEVIGYKLDGTMLADMLRTLYMHFTVPHEVERLHAYLVNITALPRFSIMTFFLATSDRIKTRNLFEFLEQHGMPVSEHIKSAYL